MSDPTVDANFATAENTDRLARLDFSPLPGVANLAADRWRTQCEQLHIALMIADTIVRKTPEELATHLTRMQASQQYPAASEMMAATADHLDKLAAVLRAAVVRLAIVAARQG